MDDVKHREKYITYSKRRERDLRAAYNRIIREGIINLNCLSNDDKADIVRNSKAPMLYLSVLRCYQILYEYYKAGGVLTLQRPEARKRQQYIVSEYERLRKTHSYGLSNSLNICKVICSSPAPSFFCDRQKTRNALFYYRNNEKETKQSNGDGDASASK